MTKGKLLYEGKAKGIYESDDDNVLIAYFKDDLTAFNGAKKSSAIGKGALNLAISSSLFELLHTNGIKTHFIKQIDENNMAIVKTDVILIEVIVRNIATGSLSKKYGIKDGLVLDKPLIEFDYKNDELNDPKLHDDLCMVLGLVDSKEELVYLREQSLKINKILSDFFAKKDIKLVDFKLEFGKDANGEIILIDELSPDNFRLWDKNTNQKLDKDIFRDNLGDLIGAYSEVLDRIKQ